MPFMRKKNMLRNFIDFFPWNILHFINCFFKLFGSFRVGFAGHMAKSASLSIRDGRFSGLFCADVTGIASDSKIHMYFVIKRHWLGDAFCLINPKRSPNRYACDEQPSNKG